YRQQAVERLQEFTTPPILDWPTLPEEQRESFDLALANHVLYYVPDIDATLTRIIRSLAPGGLFLTAIAGRSNTLMQIQEACFGTINRPVPFYNANDLESAMVRRCQSFRQQRMHYELNFPDSDENRSKILRFLLGEHYED